MYNVFFIDILKKNGLSESQILEFDTEKLQEMCIEEQRLDWVECKINNKKVIGILFTPMPYDMHLRDLAYELSEFSELSVTIIVEKEILVEHKCFFEINWDELNSNGRRVMICDSRQFETFKELDIVFLSEVITWKQIAFPINVVKIGCPHGIDMSNYETLYLYSGCMRFDYILNARVKPEQKSSSYLNLYPTELIEHKFPFVGEIPFGSPKLDRFLKAVDNCNEKNTAIIYHLSSFSLEPCINEIENTLGLLLDNFKSYKIIFRPYPRNLDHPLISKCIDKYSSRDNFILSVSNTYIDDYARAALMVVHRPYRDHLFTWATGNKVIRFEPEGRDDGFTNVLHNSSDLIIEISNILNSSLCTTSAQRRSRCEEFGIYNPGHSVKYLVENIDNIILGKKIPTWKYFDLHDENGTSIQESIVNSQASSGSFNSLAERLVLKFPNEKIFVFNLIESYLRHIEELNSRSVDMTIFESHNFVAAEIFYKLRTMRHFIVGSFFKLYFSPVFVSKASVNGEDNADVLTNELLVRCGEQFFFDFFNALLKYDEPMLFRDIMIWEKFKSNVDSPLKIKFDRKIDFYKKQMVCDVDIKETVYSGDVYIYCAGETGLAFLWYNLYENGGFNIVGLVDGSSKLHGVNLNGYNVLSPNELLHSIKATDKIIIATDSYLNEIYNYLRTELKLKNQVLYLNTDGFGQTKLQYDIHSNKCGFLSVKKL